MTQLRQTQWHDVAARYSHQGHFGDPVLVGDLLHYPSRKSGAINRLRKTAVIYHLIGPLAE
jgi:hypothetical protein